MFLIPNFLLSSVVPHQHGTQRNCSFKLLVLIQIVGAPGSQQCHRHSGQTEDIRPVRYLYILEIYLWWNTLFLFRYMYIHVHVYCVINPFVFWFLCLRILTSVQRIYLTYSMKNYLVYNFYGNFKCTAGNYIIYSIWFNQWCAFITYTVYGWIVNLKILYHSLHIFLDIFDAEEGV